MQAVLPRPIFLKPAPFMTTSSAKHWPRMAGIFCGGQSSHASLIFFTRRRISSRRLSYDGVVAMELLREQASIALQVESNFGWSYCSPQTGPLAEQVLTCFL